MATADLLVRVRSDTGSASRDLGTIGSKVAGFGRTAAKVGAAAAASLAGTVLWAGFRRLTDIDNATAKLTGLGHSTKSVERIMNNALAAVKGTSFGLGEAATVAASAVAAGVRPGKDLERTLGLVADAATIAGTDMGSMGAIFNKVAAANKIQGEELNQLADRGIPILQLLAKEMGVTTEQAREMASRGAIDFNTFRSAMESGLGGAALASGKTFTGAIKNVYAALGRLGAALLGGAFSKMPALFQTVIGWIDRVTPAAQGVGEAIGAQFGNAVSAVSRFVNSPGVKQGVSTFFQKVKEAVELIGPALADFGRMLLETGQQLGPPLLRFAGIVTGKVAPAIAGLLGFLTKYSDVIVPLVAGFVAIVAAMRTYAIVAGIMTAAQTALNAVMAANPFGLLVLALVGLAAAFVTAYQKSETFRNIVNTVLGVVKAAWSGTFNAARSIVTTTMAAINAAVNTIRAVITAVTAAIKAAWSNAWNAIKTGAANVRADLTAKFNAARDSIRNAFTAVSNWWNGRVGDIKGKAAEARADLAAKFDAAKNSIRNAFTAVKNFWAEKVGNIKSAAEEARAGLTSKFNGAKTTITGIFTAIKEAWGAAVTNIKNAVSGIGDALSRPFSAVKGAVDSAIGAVRSLIGWIKKIKVPKISLPGMGKAILTPPTSPNARSVALSARAPVVSLPAIPTANGGGGVTIIVNGAIDPEATARQIRRILGNHDRRMGFAS